MIEIEDLTVGNSSYDSKVSQYDAIMVDTRSGTVLFMIRPVERGYQLTTNFIRLREEMDETIVVLEMSDTTTKIHFLKEDATVGDLFYTALFDGINDVKMIEDISDYSLKLEVTKLGLRD